MFLTGQAEVHSLCRRLRKAFPFRKDNRTPGARNTPLLAPSHVFMYAYKILCTGEEEEADTSEAMRKFKKAKQKKTVVSMFLKCVCKHL